MLSDIFTRMTDVELLAELRRIAWRAAVSHDQATATQASALFETFYERRILSRVPAWLWDDMRAFVRRHAH
ncbi:MAG TPA: hypothetical protein VHS99_23760 [Chloroflexota bacterium]|nr:hypothetical protein [Chloroflexota bacterium]